MQVLTREEYDRWVAEIETWSQEECARNWRYTAAGHIIFRTDSPLYGVFLDHFNELGGMTPEISKRIGWEIPTLWVDPYLNEPGDGRL
jgi:hypothetical protein